MADISLNHYLAKIDTLLSEGLYDQAAFHSRNILQQKPKNIAAYRRLGQALLLDKRWEDAGDVLRRILSVAPDDASAHQGLSQTYRYADQPLEAIWHLERAHEQDTDNPQIIRELRQLYREFRNNEQPRIQLTVGAMARQYARNGLYVQAADTLKRALQQKPDRVDLRLLLARTLRDAGEQVEAASVALDVLEVLPDCMEANIILIELWLDQQRPSDAQRYLSRLETVDPYLALELARGAPPDDDAVEVLEADYQTAARRRLAVSAPDWLDQIEDDEDSDYHAAAAPAADDEQQAAPDPLDALPQDIDWLETSSGDTVVPDVAAEPAPDGFGEPQASQDAADDFEWLDDAAQASSSADDKTVASDPLRSSSKPIPPPTTRKRGLTGLLASLSDDDPKDEEESPDEPARPINTADLFADLPDAQSPSDTVASDTPPADANPAPAADRDEDPLAWLRGSDVELVDDADSVVRRTHVEFDDPAGDLADPVDEDPLAWLQQSGVELLDDDEPSAQAVADDDDFVADAADTDDEEDEDPLAWLQQGGVELLDDDEPSAQAVAADADTDDDEEDEDPLAWLQQSGVELLDDDEPSAQAAAAEQDDPLDWLADDSLLDELLDIESLVSPDDPTPGAASPAEEPPTFNLTGEEEDRQEIMPDKNDTEFPDWLTSGPDDDDEEKDAGTESDSGADEFSLDWLTSHEEETQQAQFGEPFGWDPQASTASDDDEDATDDDEAPQTESSGFGEPGLFGDTDNGFQWRESGDDEADDDEDEPFATEEGMPDWLTEMQPAATVSEEADDEEDEFAFDLGDDEEEAAEEAVPDWLTEMQPAATVSEEADDEEEEFAFDLGDDEEEAVEEAAPDWLTEMQPAATVSEEADDEEEEFAFDLGDDEDEVVEEAAPDWLTEMQPAATVSEEADDEEEEFAFDLGDDEDEAVEEAVPDWLTDMQPTAAATGAVTAALDGFDDDDDELMFDDDMIGEDEAEDVPIWLADMQQAEEAGEDEDEAPWAVETQESEVLASAEITDEDEDERDLEDFAIATEETGDWPADEALAAAAVYVPEENGFDDEPQPDGEAYPQGEVMQDDTDDEPQEWAAAAASASLLDADEDFTPFEQGPAIDEPTEDWLFGEAQTTEPISAAEDDEFADYEPFAAEYAADEPFAASAEPLEFDEVEAFEDGEEETAPTAAANAPDWLNAMVPGLDVDYEAEEDAQLEQAFDEMPAQPSAIDGAPSQRTSGDFGWLAEIVEEEFNKPPENLPAAPPPPAAAEPRQPRFSFSRPPAWLRKLRGEAPPAPAPASAVEDDELIGEDLPDWLEFDDEDDDKADVGRR